MWTKEQTAAFFIGGLCPHHHWSDEARAVTPVAEKRGEVEPRSCQVNLIVSLGA